MSTIYRPQTVWQRVFPARFNFSVWNGILTLETRVVDQTNNRNSHNLAFSFCAAHEPGIFGAWQGKRDHIRQYKKTIPKSIMEYCQVLSILYIHGVLPGYRKPVRPNRSYSRISLSILCNICRQGHIYSIRKYISTCIMYCNYTCGTYGCSILKTKIRGWQNIPVLF